MSECEGKLRVRESWGFKVARKEMTVRERDEGEGKLEGDAES